MGGDHWLPEREIQAKLNRQFAPRRSKFTPIRSPKKLAGPGGSR